MKQSTRQRDHRLERKKPNRRRRGFVRFLACLVVFCTTYALILPAITLEKTTHCGQVEHTHTDSCYTVNLICPLEQSEGHVHTDECYETVRKLICPLEEGPDHTHTEECYETVRTLICPLEESEGHRHTEECYERVLTCTLEEHTHSLACYADPSADLETEDDWEKTLPEKLSGVWADDLLAVAKSQLGYAESEKNYQVSGDSPDGYTRYGAWYGFPYENWCGMFVSFCLHYSGIPQEAMPQFAACATWVNELTEREMYRPVGGELPDPGDLIFFDFDGDGTSDHVGIVTAADETKGLDAIEGNSEDKVARCHYDWDDEKLLGYGLLPENPEPPKEILRKDLLRALKGTKEPEDAGTPEKNDPEAAAPKTTVTENEPAEPENNEAYDFSLPEGGYVNLQSVVEILGIADENTQGKPLEENALTLDGVEISEETKKFVEDVQTVEFSRPDLVWVGKIENDTTVARLKRENDLEPQYSAELTDAEIDRVNATRAEAGDWALISKQPFEDEQTLTLTTKGGEEYEITVRDSQISQQILAADGSTYDVTVAYGRDAEIPDGAELRVSEVLEGTAHYQKYLSQTARRLEIETEDITFARFFDIDIVAGGEPVEPAAEVTVRITLAGAAEEDLQIVHFADAGPTFIAPEQTEGEKGTELRFTADSFSTYGVITGPGPTSANDLAGCSVKIGRGSRYLLPAEVDNVAPARIAKGSAADAAEWTFEATGTQGVYNIYTMVDGQKKYLNFSSYSNNSAQANVSLGSSGQGLTVQQRSDGTYTISWSNGQNTYYLNEYDGSGGNGFAGYNYGGHENSWMEFTLPQPALTTGDQYMVLVKIDGDYYIVLNDGSLEKTKYPVEEDPINGDLNTVGTDTPMFWTYAPGNNSQGTVLYHPSEAVDYNYQQLASDYYYSYIDPRQDSGLSMDSPSNATVVNRSGEGNYIRSGSRTLMTNARIVYDQTNHRLVSQSDSGKALKYVEENGKYRIAGGGVEDAIEAEVYLAKRHDPDLQLGAKYHTVNHIDISVEATATAHVPLAYGTYYYVENGQVKTLVVSKGSPVTLSLSNNEVEITKEDIKSATVTAYTKDANGEQHPAPDAFIINGYSSNQENGQSTDQVRIGGVFKVADLDPVPNGDGNGNSYWRSQRLANPIYYSVATTKDVTFPLEYNGHQLYQSQADAEASMQPGYDPTTDENLLKVNSTVTLAKSFDYWDSSNECPGIHLLNQTDQWVAGDVLCDSNDSPGNLNTGMDFSLSTSSTASVNILAIEITKYLVDENDQTITPNRELSHVFHIYRKPIDKNAEQNPIDEVKNLHVDGFDETQPPLDYETGYTHLHDKTVKVGDGGMGLIYDYDMLAGMIYIEEDQGSIQRELTDVNGKKWLYTGTHLETEYVWRNDGIEYRRHFSKTYTSESEALNSIPDVLGAYRGVGNLELYNGFLEFYVYNEYKHERVDIPVKKVWQYKNGMTAEPPEGAEVTITLGRYKMVEDPENPVTGDLVIHQNVIDGETGNPYTGTDFQATYVVQRDGITVRAAPYDPNAFGNNGGGAIITGLPAGEYTVSIADAVEGFEVSNVPPSYSAVTVQNGYTYGNPDPGKQPPELTFISTVTEQEIVKTVPVRILNFLDGQYNANNYVPGNAYQNTRYDIPENTRIAVNLSRPGPGHNNSFHAHAYVRVTTSTGWYYLTSYGSPTNNVNNAGDFYTAPTAVSGTNVYEGVNQALPFQIPAADDNIQYYDIIVVHNWSEANLWINSMSQIASSRSASANAMNLMAFNAVPETLEVQGFDLEPEEPESDGTEPEGSEPARARGAPLRAGEGEDQDPVPASTFPGLMYVLDTDFDDDSSANKVTVLSGTTWEKVLKSLPPVDMYGRPYAYYIKSVEETGVPPGTELVIDTLEGGIPLTSDGLVTLTATNKIPIRIKVKKTDGDGYPLVGASFTLLKEVSGSYQPVETLAVSAGDGTIAFQGLEPGSYRIVEASAPQEYAMITDPINFTVTSTNNVSVGSVPSGVVFDGDTFTFTVPNPQQTEPGEIIVQKRWLDFYGNLMEPPDEAVHLTLRQWAVSDTTPHTVTINFRYDNNGGNYQQPGGTSIVSRSGTGVGDVSIEWDWNQWTADDESYPGQGASFSVFGLNGSTYSSSVIGHGADYNSNNGVDRGMRRRLTIHNITGNKSITIQIHNNNYDGTNSGLIYQPSFTGAGPSGVVGTKDVTLDETNGWAQSFTVEGDGTLSNASTQLPATYGGRPCSYTIVESPLLDDYTVTYSNSNEAGVGEGVLTAYNQKKTVDFSLVKVDEKNEQIRLNGAKFELRQIDPWKTGNIDTRYMGYEGIQYVDDVPYVPPAQVTSADGTLTFYDLETGYYEIKEIQPPPGYVLKGDNAFYIRIDDTGITMLEKDIFKSVRQWKEIGYTSTVSFENGMAIVTNETGPALPHSGGAGDSGFRIGGLLLLLSAALLYFLRLRRRRERRSSA